MKRYCVALFSVYDMGSLQQTIHLTLSEQEAVKSALFSYGYTNLDDLPTDLTEIREEYGIALSVLEI